MSDVVRAAAIGGVMAVLMQACEPTPIGALLRAGFEVPVYAAKSIAATRIQSNAGSLPHLQNTACQDAACGGR